MDLKELGLRKNKTINFGNQILEVQNTFHNAKTEQDKKHY